MDPEVDCAICFETFGDEACERWATSCCGQAMCRSCGDAIHRCPFCRDIWDEAEHAAGGRHPWLRAVINPFVSIPVTQGLIALGQRAPSVLQAAVGTLGNAARAGVLIVSEASPAVVAGSVAGTAVIIGGVAITVASTHSEKQAQRLRSTIADRGRCWPQGAPWREVATQLFDALRWSLSPQSVGLHKGTYVYCGSPWHDKVRKGHLAQVRTRCAGLSSDIADPAPADRIWGDLSYCFSLWLGYSPHTANWGRCKSYGSPNKMYLCWHNRWREDLRHVSSDLARHLLSTPEAQRAAGSQERAVALCLLGMLDHVLSWDVDTPDFGQSDLIPVDWRLYRRFCKEMNRRCTTSWEAVLRDGATGYESGDGPSGFVSHAVWTMATRETPEGFQGLWNTI